MVRAVARGGGGGAGPGVLDAAGHDSDPGRVLGVFSAGHHVGLPVWTAGGRGGEGGLATTRRQRPRFARVFEDAE